MATTTINMDKLNGASSQRTIVSVKKQTFTEYPIADNALLVWIIILRKQLYSYHNVCTAIDETKQQKILKFIALDECFNICYDILLRIGKDLAKDAFEKTMIMEVAKHFRPIVDLKFQDVHKVNADDIKNLRVRYNTLINRVLPYVRSAVENTAIINEVQTTLTTIYSSLNNFK